MTATKQERINLFFEDESVQQVAVRITGAGDGLSEALKVTPKALHLGDEVAYLLRGTVTQVNHRQGGDDEPIVRVHTVKAGRITEVEIEMAESILATAAENLARKKAEIDGQMEIEADEDLEGKEAMATINETGKLAPEFKA